MPYHFLLHSRSVGHLEQWLNEEDRELAKVREAFRNETRNINEERISREDAKIETLQFASHSKSRSRLPDRSPRGGFGIVVVTA
jgi:hypothetical protein